MQLDRMRMYQAAEQLVGEVDKLLPRVRTLALNSADHLDRSANSVLFNTAEGIGSFKTQGQNRRLLRRKEGSHEVRAALRSLVIKRTLTTEQIQKAYNLAGACVGMLTNAIIALENRPES